MEYNGVELTKDEEQFVKFIQSYERFYKPAYEIADNILSKDKNQFKLYSLDEICQSYKMCEIDTAYTPKTTDALWFNKFENGRFTIFLIEFKGDDITKYSTKLRLCDYVSDLINREKYAYGPDKDLIKEDINKLKPIVKKYSDGMLNDLILKPLETVTTSLPLIYEFYYEENKDEEGVEYFDIVKFLRESRIHYTVVCYDNDENPHRSHANAMRTGDRFIIGNCKKNLEELAEQEGSMEITDNYSTNLNTHYIRYTKAKIINNKEYDYFKSNRQFNNFLKDMVEGKIN